jgi:HEXXH motif-containing protein
MTAAVHELDQTLFAQLASGTGGEEAIGALRRAQFSKHLLLIQHLLAHWPGSIDERDAVAAALDRAASRSPERFRDVVGAPLVGGWTAIVARGLEQGGGTPADFRHLAAIGAVACAAAGVDGEAEVGVHNGLVAVPGRGAAMVGPADSARITVRDGRLAVHAGGVTVQVPEDGGDVAGWLPAWRLAGESAGMRLTLDLDDLDPYRHGHHAPPALRLSAEDVDRWRALYADAWVLLANHLPERAGELAAGLRTLVPLVQTDDGSARSATLRHAFGVFGLTRPPSAAEFVVTMIHEFQHSKLSAILDLVPLSDPNDDRKYFAPWRTDPRPLAGLLQGVYAFVGVADAWRALRAADGIDSTAEQQFAYARLQVHNGLNSVEQCDALTSAGRALAIHLRRTTDALLAEPVPSSAAAAAEESLRRIHQRWQQHNAVMN